MKYFPALLLTCFFFNCFGQSGIIRGYVIDEGNGEPILFTQVKATSASGKISGAVTDVNGFFSLGKIDTGSYEIRIESIDYEPFNLNTAIKSGEVVEIKCELEAQEAQFGEEIIVQAVTTKERPKIENTVIRLKKEDIEKIPFLKDAINKSGKMRRKGI